MWKALISSLEDSCEFSAPPSSEEILAVEKILKCAFPDSLKSLLLETNGVYHSGFSMAFLWDLETIQGANLEFRKNWESYGNSRFEDLLFFSEGGGNGDWFAFEVSSEKGRGETILWRDHETGKRVSVSSTLEEFIKGWLTDELNF